jgi:hypothetical protein
MPTKTSTLKTIVFGTITVMISIFGCLVMAELILRFLPYDQGLRAEQVTPEQPVFRFQPNRSSTWSYGWNFNLVNYVHVNNDGFVNNIDYDRTQSSPLLAIVGDSYIEAAMVPYAETVQGRLARALENKGRVYSFGASGAGLPQYLIWTRYARDTYHPDMLLISNIANDFAESLEWLEHSPGFWRFDRATDGSVVWRLTEYRPSLLRRVLRHSALAMYLTLNVKAQSVLNLDIKHLGASDHRWVGNIAAVTPDKRMTDYRWAVDRFIEFLPDYAGLPPSRIVISLDGFRPNMYGSAKDLAFAESSTWAKMRDYMRKKATERGIAVIDLDPLFRAQYAKDHKRFEFPTNSHWSGHGHAVLAEALTKTAAFKAVFGAANISNLVANPKAQDAPTH